MSDELIHVGDHVTDRDSDDADRMLVMARPGLSIAEFDIDEERTVADANPGYDPSDATILVAFVASTAGRLEKSDAYAYPAERLEVVASLHGGDNE
jgi:hypothetical protein